MAFCSSASFDHLHECETSLTARFAIEGKTAIFNFAVLGKQVRKMLLFGLEREIADVNGHGPWNRE
jgi:hypothetical protein